MAFKPTITAAFILTAAVGLAAGFAIAKSTYPPVQVLVSSEKTIIGQDIVYPEGAAKITGAIVTMQPGDTTGWHKHDAPLFGWVSSTSSRIAMGHLAVECGGGDFLHGAVYIQGG